MTGAESAQILAAIGELKVEVGKLGTEVANLRRDDDRAERVTGDHENRLRVLERGWAKLAGIGAVGGTVAGSIAAAIVGWLLK